MKIPVYIINLSLTAKYFGVSIERDAWLLAFSAMMFIDNVLWGPFNETFRAKFIIIKENEGENVALRKTKSLLLFIILFSFIISLIIMFYPDIISNIMAPGYTIEQKSILNKIIVYSTSCLLVNQLMQIGISVLNAYDSFYIPEIAGLITSIIGLGVIVWGAPIYGIYSLLISYLLGTFILIVLLVYQMNFLKVKIFSDYKKINFKDFKDFFYFSLPLFLPIFFTQLNSFIEKALSASLGPGVVSQIDYSRKISELLVTIFVSIITSLLLPNLTKNYMRGEGSTYQNEFLKIFQLGILGIMFVSALMCTAGSPIIHFLYDKGNISEANLAQITELSIFYVISLLSIFLYIIYGMTLISSEQNKMYGVVGMLNQIIVITVNYFLIGYFGIYIFPLSLFVVHIMSGLFMTRFFPFKNSEIKRSNKLYLSIFACNICAIYVIGKYLVLFENVYLNGAALFFAFCIVVVLQIFLLKLDERKLIIQLLTTVLKR